MSGTRTAVALLAATVVAGGALVRAGQQPAARGAQTPAAVPSARGQTPAAVTPQTQGQTPSPLPLTPTIRERGSSVTPAFEGWFHGKDGFDYVMAGYFNRNTKQEFDIPVGPNNHIDPGGPDQGQPTHFLLGRQWGMFTIRLPKDFGTKKLMWTLVVNGQTNQITLHTYPVYIVEPYKASWNDNTPPVLKLDPNGPTFTGPPLAPVASMTTTMPGPLTLDAWITDDNVGGRGAGAPAPDGTTPAVAGGAAGRGGRGGRGAAGTAAGTAADGTGAAGAPPPAAGTPATDAAAQPPVDGATPPAGRGGRGGRGGAAGAPAGGAAAAAFGGRGGISVTWAKFRGPGNVTFANAKPAVDAANGGKTETTATFDAPGDYVLRVQGNDSSGDGGAGEQCCWTSGHVKVSVKPAPAK
jgi:hypothetical protein